MSGDLDLGKNVFNDGIELKLNRFLLYVLYNVYIF